MIAGLRDQFSGWKKLRPRPKTHASWSSSMPIRCLACTRPRRLSSFSRMSSSVGTNPPPEGGVVSRADVLKNASADSSAGRRFIAPFQAMVHRGIILDPDRPAKRLLAHPRCSPAQPIRLAYPAVRLYPSSLILQIVHEHPYLSWIERCPPKAEVVSSN